MGSQRWLALTSGVAALICVLALASGAQAAGPAGALSGAPGAGVRHAIRRVENAIVDDDPGACALMSVQVQHELVQSSLTPGAHLAGSDCRHAVRRIHAAFVAHHELASTRTIVREQLATLATSPIRLEFGRRASVIVVAVHATFDGSALQTILIIDLTGDGSRWKVSSLNELQQILQEQSLV